MSTLLAILGMVLFLGLAALLDVWWYDSKCQREKDDMERDTGADD